MYQRILDSLMPTTGNSSKLARFSDWSGLIGLIIFSSFSLFSIAGANMGLALMVLGLLVSGDAWRQLLRQPLFWLCLATIGYLVLRTTWASLNFPIEPKTQINQTKDWALLFLFFIPAWWMSRTRSRPMLALSLMFIGFSLGILSALDSATLAHLQDGLRSGLHFGKPIIFGFDCAVAIIALAILVVYWLDPRHSDSRAKRLIFIGLTLTAILFFAQGLVLSQSRGVWLSILVALPAAFLILRLAKGQRTPIKHPRILFISVLAVLSLALWLNWNTISQRLLFERQELSTVVTEGLDKAPLSSSTYRLHLWKFGLGKWLEHPLIGWGPGTTYALIKAEDTDGLKNPDGSSFDHLHNAYLEVLFQMGLVGFALVCAICWVMVRSCLKAYREHELSAYLLAFLLSNFILIAVYSLTDFRHLHWNWRFYWMIIAAIVFATSLASNKPQTNHEG